MMLDKPVRLQWLVPVPLQEHRGILRRVRFDNVTDLHPRSGIELNEDWIEPPQTIGWIMGGMQSRRSHQVTRQRRPGRRVSRFDRFASRHKACCQDRNPEHDSDNAIEISFHTATPKVLAGSSRPGDLSDPAQPKGTKGQRSGRVAEWCWSTRTAVGDG